MTLRYLMRSLLKKPIYFQSSKGRKSAVDMHSTSIQECRNDKCIQNFGLEFRREETAWETLVKMKIGVILK